MSLQITALNDHRRATIPFAESYLLPFALKYKQFARWRAELDA